MANKEIDWSSVPKTLMDALLMLVFSLPALIASYIWRCIQSGWVLGELAFDPEAFHRRYGGHEQTNELLQQLRDVVKSK